MNNEKEDIVDDPLTDTQRKLRAIVVEAVREVLQEERKRFDWLKFSLFVWDELLALCNKVASEIRARMK